MTNATIPSAPPTTDPEGASATLVLGARGKTGRRVAAALEAAGVPVRRGSRTASQPFSWDDPSGWPALLDGTGAVYIVYAPDLAVPGAAQTVGAFARVAAADPDRRVVLLSGRGEPEAQRAEEAVLAAQPRATIIRSSWFAQNFSEDFLADDVLRSEIVLPAGDVAEPFIDTRDIAEIAVQALTGNRHEGQTYEVTGPRLLTFDDAAAELSAATGRAVRYVPVTLDDYLAGARAQGLPDDLVGAFEHLFAEVLDGRNASLADGVQRALGRPPRDFADFAREAAAGGAWSLEGAPDEPAASTSTSARR